MLLTTEINDLVALNIIFFIRGENPIDLSIYQRKGEIITSTIIIA